MNSLPFEAKTWWALIIRRDWEWWHAYHREWFRFVCKIRRKHQVYEENGGGADSLRCRICDWSQTLRIYDYDASR